MITLVANTITSVLGAINKPRYVQVTSDSTTITRIGATEAVLDSSTGGIGLTAYFPVNIYVPPMQKLYVVSTGTPNISVIEVSNPTNVMKV